MNNNEDDDIFFKEAMNDVQPLSNKKPVPFKKKHRPEPLNLSEGSEELDDFADTSQETPDFFDFKKPGIQNKLYQDLQRGLVVPEGNIDLHGMRVSDARPALSRFLKYSLEHGRRCVRIIHGKGQRSADNQPILKQRTYQWLQQKEEVLAFCTAPRWDGGSGATYVLLSLKNRIY